MMRIVRMVTSILLVMSSGIAADELPRVQPKEVGLSEKVHDDVQAGSRSSSQITKSQEPWSSSLAMVSSLMSRQSATAIWRARPR